MVTASEFIVKIIKDILNLPMVSYKHKKLYKISENIFSRYNKGENSPVTIGKTLAAGLRRMILKETHKNKDKELEILDYMNNFLSEGEKTLLGDNFDFIISTVITKFTAEKKNVFEFLKPFENVEQDEIEVDSYAKKVSELYEKTLNYFTSDPETAFTLAVKTNQIICSTIILLEKFAPAKVSKKTTNDIDIILSADIVPKSITVAFKNLDSILECIDSGFDDSCKENLISLCASNLKLIVEWFLIDYLKSYYLGDGKLLNADSNQGIIQLLESKQIKLREFEGTFIKRDEQIGTCENAVSFIAQTSSNLIATQPNFSSVELKSEPDMRKIAVLNTTTFNKQNSEYDLMLNLCSPVNPSIFKETLKNKFLQIALDVHDLQKALEITYIAAQSHSVIIEVGDPLIKRFGMEAVKQVRKIEPKFPLLVEMVSSDWVDEQISIAAEAGADIVLLMGLYNNYTRIEKAVDSARKNSVGLILDIPPVQKVSEWCSIYEEQGVDAIALIRNIDSSNRPSDMINRVVELRKETDLPIVVSGGFTPKLIPDIINEDWNVVIVGRAIINSPEPGKVIKQILDTIHSRG